MNWQRPSLGLVLHLYGATTGLLFKSDHVRCYQILEQLWTETKTVKEPEAAGLLSADWPLSVVLVIIQDRRLMACQVRWRLIPDISSGWSKKKSRGKVQTVRQNDKTHKTTELRKDEGKTTTGRDKHTHRVPGHETNGAGQQITLLFGTEQEVRRKWEF